MSPLRSETVKDVSMMKPDTRYVALDTETTGLKVAEGHRIVEMGLVEFMNGLETGKTFHTYIDPERDVPAEAYKVHHLSAEFLSGKPKFAERYQEMLDFCGRAIIVIHNAPFDLGFLDAELERIGEAPFRGRFEIKDSLREAQRRYPRKDNDLDSLCNRLQVDNSERTREGVGRHGALIDAGLLARVYMKMNGADGLAYAFGAPAEKKVEMVVAAVGELRTREAIGGGDPLPEELERHAYLIGKIKNPLWGSITV